MFTVNRFIQSETFDDIRVITLNRPEKRNALSPEMVEELSREIDQIGQDASVKAIILTGAGKAFCAGADLAYLRKLSQYSDEENLADSTRLAELFRKIYQLPKLTVAMINGAALAGGCGLALCCDYLTADRENARLGFTEVRIGFVPAIVMNFLIRKVSLQTAHHLTLSGKILTAEEAHRSGLIHYLFSEKNLPKETRSFAEDMLNRNSFQAMMQTKRLFQQLLDKPLDDGLKLASRVNAQSRKSADCQRGLNAFLSKQKINWRETY